MGRHTASFGHGMGIAEMLYTTVWQNKSIMSMAYAPNTKPIVPSSVFDPPNRGNLGFPCQGRSINGFKKGGSSCMLI
jgi:hypothetical protein